MTIAEIKEKLNTNPGEEFLKELENDTRAGVKKLLATYYRRIEKERAETERLNSMLSYENGHYDQGAEYVAGVDEAGRGPLAGPMVIAAVILPQGTLIRGLNDSKKLNEKKRLELYREIVDKAVAVSVNIVSVHNIDKLNIYRATQEGMAEVLKQLKTKPDVALIDAMPVEADGIKTESIIHGDALSLSIAAASVIAKVTRDSLMEILGEKYPQYHWRENKGYGSAEHIQAIKELGATIWHRRSYEPIKSMNLEAVDVLENKLIDLVPIANNEQ